MMASWMYGLWLAIDFLLVAIIGAMWVVLPEFFWLNLFLSVFAFCLSFLLFYPRKVDFITWVKSSYFKKLITELIQVALVFLCICLLNFLGRHFSFHKDITEEKINSLSEQTQAVLKGVEAPLEILYFARKTEWAKTLGGLKLFESANQYIKVRPIDPDLNPTLAKSERVQANQEVILKYQGRRVSLPLKDELSLTNAFIKILYPKERQVYLISNHENPGCQDKGPEGIYEFCERLKLEGINIHKLDLTTAAQIPRTADLVILASAHSPFFDDELEKLESYLAKGGSLLIAQSFAFTDNYFVNLANLMEKWGLKFNNDLALDRVNSLNNADGTTLVIDRYKGTHPLIQKFYDRSIVPFASSLSLVAPIYQDTALSRLMETSPFPQSWGETDFKGLKEGQAVFDKKHDHKGPLLLAAAAQRLGESGDTRILAMGTNSFFINAYFNQPGNANFILNSVSWLTHLESLISLKRVDHQHKPLIISDLHINFIFYLTSLVIPLGLFLLAFVFYRRQRNL